MKPFDHLITIDEKNKKLSIYRVFNDKSTELFTSIDLPDISASEQVDEFELFTQQLGENLLMDSPAGRKLFDL